MAWFHFCFANHDPIGRSTLVDMADWFKSGLLDLGHKVTFSDTDIETGAINVFWDCFRLGAAKKIARTNIRYGLVATEIPDGRAFNWRTEPNWKIRFDAFVEVAARASFIWTMVENTVPFYSQFAPTAYMELGFSERLIPAYIDETPIYDFSFFGLRTPYREQAFAALSKRAKVEWPERFLSSREVGELISKTKIGLNFKQSPRWPVPSCTRLGRLMMAKRGIAAEYVSIATRQGDLVGLCPESMEYADYALHLLNSNWKDRAERVFEAYRIKMPMRDIMQSVLDRTIAGLKQRGAGAVAISKVGIRAEGKLRVVWRKILRNVNLGNNLR